MRLKTKNLAGLIQPLSYVDQMLRQQGFRRIGNVDTPVYGTVIYDSATSTSYVLRIPTRVTSNCPRRGEPNVKIGSPWLQARELANNESENAVIPRPVRLAAEHKLAEIADYLSVGSPARPT